MSGPGHDSAETVRPAALGTGFVVELDRQLARAVLFGSVDGQGRMIASATARSTALPPLDDTSVAVKQVIRSIEEQVGLDILGADGVQTPASDDTGVDYFAVTGCPIAPTRLALIPLGESAVARALVEAAGRSVAVLDIVGPGVRTGGGVISGALFEQQLRAFQPDTIVLIEGSTIGVDWNTVIGTLGVVHAEHPSVQIIIIAGEHYQTQAAQALGEHADLRGIDPAEFPAAEIATALEAELQSMYESRLNERNTVASTGTLRFVSPVRAGDLVTRFLARRREQSIVYLASGDGSILHWADPAASESRVRADFDVFTNVRSTLAFEPDQVLCWLPFVGTGEELAHWILNRGLRPFTVADTARDFYWESAVLSAPMRELWMQFQAARDAQVDLIVAGRPWALWPSTPLAVVSLLNIVQPNPSSGLVDVVLDVDGIAPAAGAIGEQSPALAADAVENDLVVPAATVIVVNGMGSEGDLAVRGQLRHANGEIVRFSVPFGSMHRLPLAPGQEATLTLTCEPRFTIGAQRNSGEVVFGHGTPLHGSEVGIIIDARGRPLLSHADPTLRAARVASWFEDLGVRL